MLARRNQALLIALDRYFWSGFLDYYSSYLIERTVTKIPDIEDFLQQFLPWDHPFQISIGLKSLGIVDLNDSVCVPHG
jgi:hypothetical protein